MCLSYFVVAQIVLVRAGKSSQQSPAKHSSERNTRPARACGIWDARVGPFLPLRSCCVRVYVGPPAVIGFRAYVLVATPSPALVEWPRSELLGIWPL